MIAYRKDVFGDNGPSNWAEFWDLKNFPGKRGMHGKVNYNLEAALMAAMVMYMVLGCFITRGFKYAENRWLGHLRQRTETLEPATAESGGIR